MANHQNTGGPGPAPQRSPDNRAITSSRRYWRGHAGFYQQKEYRPRSTMANLAAQQGISTDQLRTLELHTLQKGCDAMVAQGKLSQADADQRTQEFSGWDQGTLNWYVMHAFTGQ